MKKFCYAGLLFLLIAGCQSKIPGNIIPPDKMGAILYDIHVTDAYITTLASQDSAKKVSATYYKGIYRKFDTDSARYTQSMNFYAEHPDLLSKIYETVTASLKKSKDSIDKVNEKILKVKTAKRAKAVKDSLAKIDPKVLKIEADKKAKKTKDSLEKIKPAVIKPVVIKKVKKEQILKRKTQLTTAKTDKEVK